MSGGLYLGALALPFISSLRVFLPEEAYSEQQFKHLQSMLTADQDAVALDASELSDSLSRVIRKSASTFPNSSSERVRVLQLEPDQPKFYAPNQIVSRSLLATSELLEGPAAGLARLVLPHSEWDKHLERLENTPDAAGRLQNRTASWGVPFSWFILIGANDRMEVVEANGKVLTVRVQVPLAIATSRAARTLAMLEQMAPELELFEELDQLHDWLESFDSDGIVEIDYGPIAARVYPDDSPADVSAGLRGLAEGDLTSAAAAYRRLSNRWAPIRALARAN